MGPVELGVLTRAYIPWSFAKRTAIASERLGPDGETKNFPGFVYPACTPDLRFGRFWRFWRYVE
jgi:hypothetical protein